MTGAPRDAAVESALGDLVRLCETGAPLGALGERLSVLARGETFDTFVAGDDADVAVLLGNGPGGRPALYVVSDRSGVVSPPHEHLAFSVVVSLRGEERNVLYRRLEGRVATRVSERIVRPGDVFLLAEDAIHETAVVSPEPTLHLHLYGRLLADLPPFASRTFVKG